MKRSAEIVLRLRGAADAPAFACARWIVRRGQQWVVAGPNGSGKSYLAAMLAGDLPPRQLDIEYGEGIEGRVALVSFSQQSEQAAAGWLQERWHSLDSATDTLSSFLSYREVFEINPFERHCGDTATRRRFAQNLGALAERFDLRQLLPLPITALSNGEMRRVLIVRALLREPALLVLDDPFAGLDTDMRARLKLALAQLAEEGLPMVLMIRHRDEIPAYATHLLLLDDCRITRRKRLAPQHHEVRQPSENAPLLDGAATHRSAPSTGRTVIEMRNITIRYGRRTLLDGLSWRVCAGERWLLTGPNGSGKTTILSLVTGDNPASYAHDVKVLGQPRRTGESIWRVRRRIGEVSPEIQAYFDQTATSLETALSGRRNADGAIMRATPAARAEARRWLGHFGVKQFADAPFGALSAGSQRLVLLARAMLPRPELLLLDEPCLNLEGSAHRLVLRTVERLMRSQPDLALVCVAHRAQDIPNGITHHLALT